jgi:hypothetical protein
MKIPRRVGIEQRISEQTLGSQTLARFTGGVAPAQLALSGDPGGIAVVYGDTDSFSQPSPVSRGEHTR